jgi:formiminoglutamase
MLHHWLKPLSADLLKHAAAQPEHSLGRKLVLHRTGDEPQLKSVKVALLGVGDAGADAVRKNLYPLVGAFPEGAVADLGNLRKTEAGLLIPLLNELLKGKVLPIVLATDDHFARAQFLAYQDAKALVNLAVVHERLLLTPADPYTPLLLPRHPLLFHFGLIGCQSHFTPPGVLDHLNENHFDVLRLGKTRAALEETEPEIRDADLMAFHLAALKQTEAPATAGATPSGYFTEEACQLCRYAGMSDKLTSFGIYGFDAALDLDSQSAQVVSQMLWYFLEGVFNRKQDYPVSNKGLTEYIVEFRKLHYQLTFWKSVKSGRWWMQVPSATHKKHDRHRLIPCSFQDYQSACREELPDRLLQAMKRF